MNVCVVLAHPHKGSLNHAIAETARETLIANGYQVSFHDLYEEGFDPVLPSEEIAGDNPVSPEVQRYCNEIAVAEGFVIVHPNWWGQPPAILKGWVDRVIRPGVAYRFEEGDTGEGIPKGLLKARAALVFNTSNTPPEREARVFGDPLERLWKDCIFGLCGVETFVRKTYGVVATSSLEQRKAWLAEVEDAVSGCFPLRTKGP